MFIAGLGGATPPRCYTQAECWEVLIRSRKFSELDGRSKSLLKKILLGQNGIECRHLALSSLEQAFNLDPDTCHQRFAEHAPALAEAAAREALHSAEIDVGRVDALLISTCTGYLCPGLTSYLNERLGLRTDIFALDLVGQGCGAAIPNLRTAEALLAAGRAENVLTICVEVCSAAFYLDNDPGVLVSACLFGDGAAAAVCSNDSGKARRKVRWETCRALLSAADRELLRFETRGGMLRNILSLSVPELAAAHVEKVLAETLAATTVQKQALSAWILHAGGRNVLSALKARLELSDADLVWSSDILRRFGNLSSSSVLFVLRAALESGAPGGYWWMTSFGAGFSCYGALLHVS